jgi:hypothetical protein
VGDRERSDVVLDLELGSEQRHWAVLGGAVARAVDQMRDSCRGRSVREVSAVAELSRGTGLVGGPGSEQRVSAGSGAGDAAGILEVAVDDLGSEAPEASGGERLDLAGHRPDRVATGEQDLY